MEQNRPRGREKHMTGSGKEVRRRGDGLGTGPVGSGGSAPQGGNHGSGGGSTRASGKRSPLTIILALLVLLGGGGGGLTALYASVLDERFRRICIAGYVNSFKTSILRMWHCPDNYVPDILNTGDIADFACALAPRVLVTESGKKDPLFPIDGTLPAIEKIRRVYSLLGAENNYTADVFDGKHQVHGAQSFTLLSE